MPNRLLGPVALTLFGSIVLLGACSDDDTNDATGGTGGSAAGTGGAAGGKGGSGGKASGGSSGRGGSSGSSSKGGSGGSSAEGGSDSEGGTGNAAGGAAGGGDPGTGGEGGEAPLTYSCNTVTNHHKACSAFVAASCTPATDCADCVTARNGERELFTSCPACVGHFDAMIECGVAAFESGNLAAGVECVPDYGADFSISCYAHLDQAIACSDYEAANSCPETWPL